MYLNMTSSLFITTFWDTDEVRLYVRRRTPILR